MQVRNSLLVGIFLWAAASVQAGSHTWQFNEIFDSTGRIQFIELVCHGDPDENFVGGLLVTTNNGSFTFPGHLAGSTLERFLLLATARFAALPGAPTPDYIIPENFISLNGGFIRYNPSGNYDTWNYGPGVIPTNGTSTVQFTDWTPFSSNDTFVVSPSNSPTNYNGGTGSINAACLDADGDGFGNPGDANCSAGPQTDCDDSNPNVRPNALENEAAGNCGDGSDNDCDGLVDCAEAGCANVVGACVPTVSEWGVVVLTLTILCAGSVMLRGRV
jgi:hypothetical protein